MSRKIPVDNRFAHAGVAAYFDRPLWRDPARVERIARLLLDERWPWLPWYASRSYIDRPYGPSERVGGKNGADFLMECLLAPTVRSLTMCRAVGDGNHGQVSIDTGRHMNKNDAPFSFVMLSRCAELPAGKSIAAWQALAQDLIVEVAPLNAVLCVWPAFDPAISDLLLVRMILDTAQGDFDFGVLPSAADRTDRRLIGKTYARHPRWGTYLSDAHLAAIGGTDHVRAVVEPARIDRLGDLTYFQLTDSIETAMTTESGARRQRFEALMTPILEPR